MPDLSEDIRLPVACPKCGSHLYRVSEVHNPDDKVFCASCKYHLCSYAEAAEMLKEGPSSKTEALIEKVVNRHGK
ncbi:hypothetical protein [Billgrantia montanilacus]|uniref:Uncharacterized protein n=1 Tax=Billgrantia montanilacus TaxID=2282305 RepID=A0A368TUR5_9GAMM|nr:hypothetical protein [Halomonas montanilacus]RCV88378.1 hypothetical protein DU505_13920 [Halomonas montanilacus]